MADKMTTEKVKELLDGHVYAPLRETAEKWLAQADEKFDVKEKAGKAWDKLNEAAESYSEASAKFNEKMDEMGDKFTEGADKVSDSELVAKLKEGVATVNETIEHFSDPKVRAEMGEEIADQIKKHAENLKAEGKTYCDCKACTKAREILKDLGVELKDGKDDDKE